MEQTFSNAQLVQGLINADLPTLQLIYTQIRPGVYRALANAGAGQEAVPAFFQLAITDAADLYRNGQINASDPLFESIEQLALAHFYHWSNAAPPAPLAHWLPDAEQLTDRRNQLYAWSKWNDMPPACHTEWEAGELSASCRASYEQALHLNAGGDTPLPSWPYTALERKTDYAVWKQVRQWDSYTEKGLTLDGETPPKPENKVNRYVMGGLLAAFGLFLLYSWITRPKAAGEIFKENFTPPPSLLADINRRFANDTSGIERPEACTEILQQADAYYAKQNYSATKDMLLDLMDNESLNACHSDACFGLCIVSLKQEDPAEALQYLAKIDNIEAYGEEVYWYQALSFVQIAKINVGTRPLAAKALKRFLEHTRNEERRQQAEKMLQEIGE